MFVLHTGSVWAINSYELTNRAIQDGVFSPPVWYHKETEGKPITLEEAKVLFTQNTYRRATEDFNAGISQPSHWFKILLEFSDDFDVNKNPLLYLDIQDPLLDVLEVYHEVDGELAEQFTAGDTLPFSSRPFDTTSFVFPIRIKPGESHSYWIRITTRSKMHIPVKVWTPQEFYTYESTRLLSYGGIYGLAAVMLIYNLAIGVRVKSSDYFAYTVLLVCALNHRLFIHGFSFQYLWPNSPEFNNYMRIILISCVNLSFIIFTQHFLATKEHMPRLHKCLNLWIPVSIAVILSMLLIPYHYTFQIMVWIGGIGLLMVYAIGIEAWINKLRMGGIFFIAIFFAVAGAVTNILTTMGALPVTALTNNAPEIGMVLQIIVLAIALSARISSIQNDKLEAEQKNNEHMAQYQDLYEKSFDGIFNINNDGTISQMNPAFRTIFNFSNNTPSKEKSFWDYWPNPHSLKSLQERLRTTTSVRDFVCELKKEDDTNMWVSITMQASQKNGELHYDGVIRDISESKEKEKALLEKQHAEAATSAKSTFLANMSHEIRTPLTAIIGFAEDARDESLNREELNESVDTIIRSSHHLLEIINEILDISKVEAGKLDLEAIDVNLPQLINDIQAVFDKRISAKGLAFILDYQLPIPKIMVCDPTRLKQIILNLLSNALKFTERGSVTLRIEYNQPQDLITFNVIDTGIGMTPPQQAKIFDAFTQADKTTTRNYGGTGLGLNIVKQLTELMGGQVSVTSEVGVGSTFSAELPARTTEKTVLITDTNQIKAASNDRESITIPTLDAYILYADDNLVNRQLVAKMLKKTGARIKLVENGAEAIECALEEPPDLILMDIKMPVISGKTACVLLRSHGFNKPIIAFTANVMASEIEGYLNAGFNSHLEKPIDIPLFYKEISRHCASSASTNDAKKTTKLTGRILVAEDNSVNQMVIRRYLQSQGAEITIAANGQEAVEHAKNEHFDLILMDLEMPIMDGWEAFKTLSLEEAAPPIYALTADNGTSTKRRCEELGFLGVLLKPIEKPEIRRVLELHLQPAPTN